MTYEQMTETYNTFSAATLYNIGFVFHHILYGITLRHIPAECLKPSHASSKRGGTQRIRIRLNNAIKLALIEMGAEMLGPETLLDINDGYNRGDHYERIITERAGQVWVKDSTPFYIAGDLFHNGEQIQIKLDGATLVEEKTLLRLVTAA
jgi:hypothetical protein